MLKYPFVLGVIIGTYIVALILSFIVAQHSKRLDGLEICYENPNCSITENLSYE